MEKAVLRLSKPVKNSKSSKAKNQRSTRLSGWVERANELVALWPKLTLTLLTLAALGPFIAKPFTTDEPLFLWVAKHIHVNPANPYDFMANWNGNLWHMSLDTKNPPLASYYIALAALIAGWSEVALHTAFLLPAIAVILGTYRLAKRFCKKPVFAAVTTLFTPVFLVSSSTIMCDTLMLAFWMWAMVLWIEGIEKQNYPRLIISGFLIMLSAYTKYYGICLIPLLAVYSFMVRRKLGIWLFCFLIPIAGIAAYQKVTAALYGQGLFSDAGDFALHANSFGILRLIDSGLTALAFAGACVAIVTLLTPWLWRGWVTSIIAAITVILALVIFANGSWWAKFDPLPGSSHELLGAQVVFWAIGGMSLLGLTITDVWKHRDAQSILLALWISGTFLFAAYLNWVLNGRSLLPMVPAVGILLARRLSEIPRESKSVIQWPAVVASVLAALLAMSVVKADYNFAMAAQSGAQTVGEKYSHGPAVLWFEGHWGWQYYLQEQGATALDLKKPSPPDGDLLAIPDDNSNVVWPNKSKSKLLETLLIGNEHWLSAGNANVGAGFYSSVFGPLPFAFGKVPQEKIYVFMIGAP